uniref:Zinc finger protein 346 n=1 Tax=Hucho hucho TaxID=62062 RepID=A0A4W5NMI7_9TELE
DQPMVLDNTHIKNMALEEPNGDFPYLPSGAAEVNKMIKENGDLFSDALCKVCNAVLNSDSQKLAHYQSKKHANKVRRYMSIHKEEEPTIKRFKSPSGDSASSNGETDRSKACHICNMTFSSPVVAESHYQGKVHTKNLRLKTLGHQPPGNGPSTFMAIYSGAKKYLVSHQLFPPVSPASTVKGYPCTVCNIELNSVEQYQAHISGSKHKNHSPMFISPSENKYTAENQQSEYQYTPEAEPVQEDWGAFSQDYE